MVGEELVVGVGVVGEFVDVVGDMWVGGVGVVVVDFEGDEVGV